MISKDRMKTPIIIFNLLLLALLVVACQAPQTIPTPWSTPLPTPPTPVPTITPTPLSGVPVPFQTLMEAGKSWEPGFSHPAVGRSMHIIASQQDIRRFDWVQRDVWLETLREVDYSKRLAIVVFQGGTPSSGYTTEITRISRLNDIVYVEAEMRDPSFLNTDDFPFFAQDSPTFPYHVVTIEKEGLNDKMTFILAANTEFLDELEVEIDQN
jgi:hypothetical protein